MFEGITSNIRGKFDHKLDPKNRVAIPAEWNPNAGGSLLLIALEEKGDICVKVLTERKLSKIYSDVEKDPKLSTKAKNDFLEWLSGECVEATVNSQGKLLIPKKLCEEANLQSDVVLIGRETFFEIWEPAAFDKMHTVHTQSANKIRSIHGFV